MPVLSWWSRSCSSAGVLSRSASSTISSSAHGPQLLLRLAKSFGVWSSRSMPQRSCSCRNAISLSRMRGVLRTLGVYTIVRLAIACGGIGMTSKDHHAEPAHGSSGYI
jgi:hypothetical protein